MKILFGVHYVCVSVWRFRELFIWNSRSERHAEAPGFLLKERWLLIDPHNLSSSPLLFTHPLLFLHRNSLLSIIYLFSYPQPYFLLISLPSPFPSNLQLNLNTATEAKTTRLQQLALAVEETRARLRSDPEFDRSSFAFAKTTLKTCSSFFSLKWPAWGAKSVSRFKLPCKTFWQTIVDVVYFCFLLNLTSCHRKPVAGSFEVSEELLNFNPQVKTTKINLYKTILYYKIQAVLSQRGLWSCEPVLDDKTLNVKTKHNISSKTDPILSAALHIFSFEFKIYVYVCIMKVHTYAAGGGR